jgi:hypothetical protein
MGSAARPWADRIGHGVRSVEDPALIEHLAAEGIPLEVCPTSNICLGVYLDLAEHALPQLLSAGVPVSLNRDDPPMFGNRWYRSTAAELGRRAGVRAGGRVCGGGADRSGVAKLREARDRAAARRSPGRDRRSR